MHKKQVLTAAISSALLSLTALAPHSVQAVEFSRVYVFGDSLSDSGYYRPFLISLGMTAPLASNLGRFTTNPGPAWSEIIAQKYGGNAASSNAGGNNYAQGGARVVSDSSSTPPGAAQRSITTQVTEYLTASGNKADARALYTMWAGANDIFQNFSGIAGGTVSASTVINTTVGAEIQQIGRLQAAGAKYMLVFGIPDLGGTPQFAELGAAAAGAATQVSAGYNTALWTGLASNGIKVIPVDTFALINDARANAAQFGFSNITSRACGALPPFTTSTTISAQFCYGGNLVSANAGSTHLFADGVHPTAAGHAIVADFVQALIEGPHTLSLLAEVPLASREAHINAIEAGINSNTQAAIGKFHAFASADDGKANITWHF